MKITILNEALYKKDTHTQLKPLIGFSNKNAGPFVYKNLFSHKQCTEVRIGSTSADENVIIVYYEDSRSGDMLAGDLNITDLDETEAMKLYNQIIEMFEDGKTVKTVFRKFHFTE